MKSAVDPAGSAARQRDIEHVLPMVRRYLCVLGVAGDRLDDIVQEACLVALQKDVPVDKLGAFLRGVARNLVLRAQRTAAARREVELAHEVWCEDGDDDGDARLEALRTCTRSCRRAVESCCGTPTPAPRGPIWRCSMGGNPKESSRRCDGCAPRCVSASNGSEGTDDERRVCSS